MSSKPGTDETVPRRRTCAAWTVPSVPGSPRLLVLSVRAATAPAWRMAATCRRQTTKSKNLRSRILRTNRLHALPRHSKFHPPKPGAEPGQTELSTRRKCGALGQFRLSPAWRTTTIGLRPTKFCTRFIPTGCPSVPVFSAPAYWPEFLRRVKLVFLCAP